MEHDFRVIDTEGTPLLREVAVYDSRGRLILEARVPHEEDSYYAADLARALPDILGELRQLLPGQPLIAHNAAHDRVVLEASFRHCGLVPPELDWVCTLDGARRLHPGLDSYALASLCEQLDVGGEPFCRDQAHLAAYDARHTYLLYRQLQRDEHGRRLHAAANPFSSSRVDTPFQVFADEHRVNQVAFQRLASVLRSVADDPNQQSQGAVLIGEPGAGKTHLVMRLAQEVLQNNRLLFVRQPTQAEHVLFHIYSRTVESLVERVGQGDTTQLDLLLNRAIRRLWTDDDSSIGADRDIRAAMEADDLTRLGPEGSEARRYRWERIEKRLLRWWGEQQGAAGYGRQILQGMLRCCRYTKPEQRESCRRWLATGDHEPVGKELDGLSAWNDPLLREEFSLQALRVIGKLSGLDQPLIMVFDQLVGLWMEGNRPVLMRFGEVVKEIFTYVPHTLILLNLFPDRWQAWKRDFDGGVIGRVGQHEIWLDRPGPKEMEAIVDLRLRALGASARSLFSPEELQTLLHQSSIRRCLNRAGALYEHRVRGVPLAPEPTASSINPASNGAAVALQGSTISLERQLASLEHHVVSLEHQFHQVLQRLSQLETSRAQPWSGAPPLPPPPAASVPPAEALSAKPPTPTRPERPTPSKPAATPAPETSAEEAVFLLHRQSWLTTLQGRWQERQIVDASDDAGKLRQIFLVYGQIATGINVDSLLKLGSKTVPDNVMIRVSNQSRCIALLHTDSPHSITARLNNLNQLVSKHPHAHFYLFRDQFSTTIRSPGALKAMEAFRNGNGDGKRRTHWLPLDLQRRVELEYTFQLVTDILNKEVELRLREAWMLLIKHQPKHWIVTLSQHS